MAVKKIAKVVKKTKVTKVVKAEKVEVKKNDSVILGNEVTPESSKVKDSGPASRGEQARMTRGQFSIPVYSLVGKETAAKLELPKEIFGVEVNKKLLAQALRVYQNNQKQHHSHTKTRGEVRGSTRKIFKQKGTGRARHGSIMAPIFVGGGIALGPKSRKVVLDLPKKMKKAALISALSQKMADKKIYGVEGLSKLSGKTKDVATLIKGVGEKSVLVLSDGKEELAVRAIRNIRGVDILPASQINALEIVAHQSLLLSKESVEMLQVRFSKKGEEGS